MVDDTIRFLRELRQLRSEAGLEPVELAARAHYPHDVIVAAEAGPGLPELPVLSAYVRGCGGGLAEWEERWRSVTGSPATSLHLPARPAGCSSLAEAGAQAACNSPAVVDPEHQRRILAAITRAATKTAEATIPAQQPARPSSPSVAAARELIVPSAAAPGAPAAVPPATLPTSAAPRPPAVPAAAAVAASEPAAVSVDGLAPEPASPPAARATRRSIAARGAALPYGAGIAAVVAALMCVIGTILLLLR